MALKKLDCGRGGMLSQKELHQLKRKPNPPPQAKFFWRKVVE